MSTSQIKRKLVFILNVSMVLAKTCIHPTVLDNHNVANFFFTSLFTHIAGETLSSYEEDVGSVITSC